MFSIIIMTRPDSVWQYTETYVLKNGGLLLHGFYGPRENNTQEIISEENVFKSKEYNPL